jgi:hypothetical protein
MTSGEAPSASRDFDPGALEAAGPGAPVVGAEASSRATTAAAIPTPAPASAAPTMPDVLRYWAVTIGARAVRYLAYFAYSLLTPPPRMMRSGQNQRSRSAMYSLNSWPHFRQLIPRRSRAAPETRVSASFPR